jgi:hypothetical protein
MTKITLQNIRDLNPCYDPTKYLSKNWSGTIQDILLLEECPAVDRLWVAVRLLPKEIAEIFAIDCAFSAANIAANVTAAYVADAAYAYAAAYAADAAADAAYAYAAYAAADAAYADAAAYAADAAAYVAADAAADATLQERENQIDALIMLIEGEVK